MPTKLKPEDVRIEPGDKSNPSSTVYSQPWWHGIGINAISLATSNGLQVQGNGKLDDGTIIGKETQPAVALQSGI